ncbi:hypothetical protein FOWG_17996 [Fusarium oxysporum f. sp. lycopersici MN25]|nr:hypothetical protein FOWG_17996 [Fusarium oxysporum f. sp. lycopersici MN25]
MSTIFYWTRSQNQRIASLWALLKKATMMALKALPAPILSTNSIRTTTNLMSMA